MSAPYECLDNWYDSFLYRMGQSRGYLSQTGLSAYPDFSSQLAALSELMRRGHGLSLEAVMNGSGEKIFKSKREIEGFINAQPQGTHALIVGFGNGDNHAIYAGRGPGGVSFVNGQGFEWGQYLIFLVR